MLPLKDYFIALQYVHVSVYRHVQKSHAEIVRKSKQKEQKLTFPDAHSKEYWSAGTAVPTEETDLSTVVVKALVRSSQKFGRMDECLGIRHKSSNLILVLHKAKN